MLSAQQTGAFCVADGAWSGDCWPSTEQMSSRRGRAPPGGIAIIAARSACFVAPISSAELAQIHADLGLNEEGVRGRIFRARKVLKERLAQCDAQALREPGSVRRERG